jgi:hypothetical protein
LLLLLAGTGSAHAARLTLDAVNKAEFSAGKSKGPNAAILKAQVLLDRARFSPGVIDGADGDNFKKGADGVSTASAIERNRTPRRADLGETQCECERTRSDRIHA